MDLQTVIRESYSREDDTFIDAVILPEVITTPPARTFNPLDVTGIQVWNRGLCAIEQRYAFGDWYVFLLREYGSEVCLHVMAFNTVSGQWLHVRANFDYQPVGTVVKRTLARNWPPKWLSNILKPLSSN